MNLFNLVIFISLASLISLITLVSLAHAQLPCSPKLSPPNKADDCDTSTTPLLVSSVQKGSAPLLRLSLTLRNRTSGCDPFRRSCNDPTLTCPIYPCHIRCRNDRTQRQLTCLRMHAVATVRSWRTCSPDCVARNGQTEILRTCLSEAAKIRKICDMACDANFELRLMDRDFEGIYAGLQRVPGVKVVSAPSVAVMGIALDIFTRNLMSRMPYEVGGTTADRIKAVRADKGLLKALGKSRVIASGGKERDVLGGRIFTTDLQRNRFIFVARVFRPLPGVTVKEIRLLTDLIDFIFWKIASAAGRKMRADGRTELLRGDVSSDVNGLQKADPDGWDSLVTQKMTVVLTDHYFYGFETIRRFGVAEDSFDVIL